MWSRKYLFNRVIVSETIPPSLYYPESSEPSYILLCETLRSPDGSLTSSRVLRERDILFVFISPTQAIPTEYPKMDVSPLVQAGNRLLQLILVAALPLVSPLL